MANELCPRCGSEMVKEFTRCVDADGNAEVFYSCPLDPKDCRIAELERQLEEANARAEDMKQRNAKLRQERIDYYNGSALEAANNEITELEGQADALYATVCQRDALLADLAAKESQLREVQSERDAALAQVGEAVELFKEMLPGWEDYIPDGPYIPNRVKAFMEKANATHR